MKSNLQKQLSFCGLLVLLEQTRAENVVFSRAMRKVIFKDTPKYWQVYVQTLSHNLLRDLFSHKFTSRCSYLQGKINTNNYLNEFAMKAQLNEHFHSKGVSKYKICTTKQLTIMDKILQQRPDPIHRNYGVLNLFRPTGRLPSFDYFGQFANFRTSKLFWLVLNFDFVYFSASSISKCYYGNLSIYSLYTGQKWTDTNGQRNIYCGIHSQIWYFSASHTVDVVMRYAWRYLGQYVVVNMAGSFSVVDCKRIYSSQNYSQILTKTPSWTFSFLQTKSHLAILHIEVEKFNKIKVTIVAKKKSPIQVYDGPGSRSKLLKLTNARPGEISWFTSSFQCVIYCLNHPATHRFVMTYFSMHSQNFTPLYFKDNTTVHLATLNPGLNIKMMRVTTDPGVYINITILDIMHDGEANTVECNHGGLAAYHDFNTTRSITLSTECVKPRFEKFGTQHDHYRNIYSKSELVYLVFYCYQEYNIFSVSLHVQASNCTSVVINTCKMGNLKQRHKTYFVLSDEEQCVVAQFIYKDDTMAQCKAEIKIGNIPQFDRKIIYNVVGFFRGKLISNKNIELIPL